MEKSKSIVNNRRSVQNLPVPISILSEELKEQLSSVSKILSESNKEYIDSITKTLSNLTANLQLNTLNALNLYQDKNLKEITDIIAVISKNLVALSSSIIVDTIPIRKHLEQLSSSLAQSTMEQVKSNLRNYSQVAQQLQHYAIEQGFELYSDDNAEIIESDFNENRDDQAFDFLQMLRILFTILFYFTIFLSQPVPPIPMFNQSTTIDELKTSLEDDYDNIIQLIKILGASFNGIVTYGKENPFALLIAEHLLKLLKKRASNNENLRFITEKDAVRLIEESLNIPDLSSDIKNTLRVVNFQKLCLITKNHTAIKSGISKKRNFEFELDRYHLVLAIKKENNWVNISFFYENTYYTGWVKSKYLKRNFTNL